MTYATRKTMLQLPACWRTGSIKRNAGFGFCLRQVKHESQARTFRRIQFRESWKRHHESALCQCIDDHHNSTCAELISMAEQELAVLFTAVTELFGSEQARALNADNKLGEMRCEKVRRRAATSESQTVYSACSGWLLSCSPLLSGRQITRNRQRWLASSVRSMCLRYLLGRAFSWDREPMRP